ncbi:radical SAM protein [Ancylomarina euxinus]|uniref:Radical SAM protein n=1 Tax=Ancylomarina euxinus TaxID=2283627 RepID=A0A425Y4C0_9BACT|nr:radical SAM protein [Ancylomarina euxinus]MCZ4694593.1 cobalamin-dependent protein [Ancylomarina euxinus]MUP14136.1 radical SAM protein [Ancylomarina euxinus]RRG22991.1 radical SAM protein [Ancylomarina euxinus]
MKKEYKVILVSMSGVRVFNEKLLKTGLTLPGFVDRSRVIASLPSLGLLTLAAHTPDAWEVIYRELDAYTDDDIADILNEKPNIVAFSALTSRINETYELAAQFRKQGVTVVMGGLHVSALPDEAIAHADAVVQGECEMLWKILLKDYESNTLKALYSSLTEPKMAFHLEDSKVPAYDLLDISNYNRLTIQTTRGCPHDCHFCAASRTISDYKKKPIKLIKKELDKIFEIWDNPFIELADDNTFVDKEWSKDLLRLFTNYKMKWFTETDISIACDDELLELLAKSNCMQVLIGLESVNFDSIKGLDGGWKSKQFKNYSKAIDKIQSYGITVNGCFVLGFDSDTKETFRETEQFIRESHLSDVQITILTAFPCTDLYQQLKNEGRLLTDYWDKCTLFDVTYQPKNFSVEELEDEFQNLMTHVYSDEMVIRRKEIFKQTLLNRKKFIAT